MAVGLILLYVADAVNSQLARGTLANERLLDSLYFREVWETPALGRPIEDVIDVVEDTCKERGPSQSQSLPIPLRST